MTFQKEDSPPVTELGRRRVQLDFSQEAYRRILAIRDMSAAKSNAEVVRNALRLYEWFLELKRAKSKLQIVQNDTTREVEILF